MKVLQSSSRGRSRGRGRGGDQRFASRFTDPRFQVSQRLQKKPKHSLTQEFDEAARDPRFAEHLKNTSLSDEEEEELDLTEELEPTEELDPKDEDVCDWAGGEEVEFIEARHRIAVVNCNWDHVRAVDLYAILFYALPLGGELREVCVYPSEFGKKMMEHERVHGPDLWLQPGEADRTAEEEPVPQEQEWEVLHGIEEEEAEAEEEAETEEEDDGWLDDNPEMLQEEGENGELFSSSKYRQYEINRMKYYYAIATFDSADTAAAVYHELDGIDIEASGVRLDLRYVDDDETFDSKDLVSRADHIPTHFKPLASLKNSALSQTRFRISWDQDDPVRHHSVQDSFAGTTPEDDLAAYLADSDSDDEKGEEQKRKIRRKYAALLEEIGADPDDVESDGVSAPPSESDDDDLNRLSDVESSVENPEMEVEGTLDLDADSKAAALQREMRTRRLLESGDLSSRAEAKYKLRRKEAKKLKKELLEREREEEREAKEAARESQKQKLKALIGTDDDGAVRISGKERRKAHAKEVKQKAAEEREAKKQKRAASLLGVSRQVQERQVEAQSSEAVQQIDHRFQSKLLSDPRYHLDVAQRDKRVSSDVAELAANVSKAKRRRDKSASSSTDRSAVDYFLQNPDVRRTRR